MKNIGLLMVLIVAAIVSGCGVYPVEKPLASQVIEAQDGVSWEGWTVYKKGEKNFLQENKGGIIYIITPITGENYLFFRSMFFLTAANEQLSLASEDRKQSHGRLKEGLVELLKTCQRKAVLEGTGKRLRKT